MGYDQIRELGFTKCCYVMYLTQENFRHSVVSLSGQDLYNLLESGVVVGHDPYPGDPRQQPGLGPVVGPRPGVDPYRGAATLSQTIGTRHGYTPSVGVL